MLKKFQLPFVAVVVIALAAFSCQSASKDIRQAAAENVQNNTVQPANPNVTAQTPQQPSVPAGPTTTMTFEETEFDFGTVIAGEKVSHVYKFTNTGNEPLILSDAKGSCGCTVPKWPREPIAPGQTSEILVEFNSANKSGQRNQKVTITANTNPPQTFIYLKGTVEAGAGATQPTIQVN